MHLLVAESESLHRFSAGAIHQTIYYPEVKAFHICVPALSEQKRIVAILEDALEGIDAAIANTEKSLVNAREVFDSYLNSALASRKDACTERSLEDVCEITSRLVDPRISDYADLPHIGAGNMIGGTDQIVDVKTAREEGLKSGKFLFDSSMVLYSKIRPYLMKACRPNFDGLCSADVYPLLPKKGTLNRDYLFHLLMTKRFTDYAISGSDRVGMPKVNREHLFKFRMSLPGIEEQSAIAISADGLAEKSGLLLENANRKLACLGELRRSILQNAFCGKLTVGPAKLPDEVAA